jgi:hypothetical protein
MGHFLLPQHLLPFPTDCVVACVNLQVFPQRDTCKSERHPRPGVLFSIHPCPALMLMGSLIAVYY